MKILSFIFFLFLVAFPFGQLTRLPVLLDKFPEVHFYLTDTLVSLIVIFWLGRHFLKKEKIKKPPLTKPILFFGLVAGLSLLFNTPLLSGGEVIVAGLYLIRWLVYAGLYFFACDYITLFTSRREGKKEAKKDGRHLEISRGERHFVIFDSQKRFELTPDSILRFLLVIGLMVAVFGLIQYLLWPNLLALEVLQWDPHFYRLVSTFLDPGFTGLILVLTLILIVILGWNKREKRGWVVAGLITYSALALTHSRSSYLSYVIGMGVIAWLKKAPKFFLAIFLLGLATLLFLPRPAGEGGKLGRTYSIEARFRNWENALIIARDHPLLGVGFNAYRYAQRDYDFLEKHEWQMTHAGAGSDSSLLFVLATTGIFGLLAYLWLWARILLTPYFSLRTSPSRKGLVVFSSAIAVLVHSWFLNSLFYPWIMAWLWMLLAVRESK